MNPAATNQSQRTRGNLGTGDGFLLGPLVRGRGDQHQFVFQERLRLDIAVSRWSLNEAQRDILLFDGLDNLLRVSAGQREVSAWMTISFE
jgi:hypothetical protein